MKAEGNFLHLFLRELSGGLSISDKDMPGRMVIPIGKSFERGVSKLGPLKNSKDIVQGLPWWCSG